MDRRTDDDGRPRTPLERIKAEHEQMREAILYGDEDELDWDLQISPFQVGLKQAWADDNGKLWIVVRDGDNYKLKRIWTIT